MLKKLASIFLHVEIYMKCYKMIIFEDWPKDKFKIQQEAILLKI